MKWLNHCAIGDCRHVLKSMATDGVKVQCVVTSPPYFGLRDYGTASWEGGRKTCEHLHKTGGIDSSTLGLASGGNDMSDEARRRSTERSFVPYRDTCAKCGARRIDQQLGLERSPEEFIANLVGVFRLVREVLADDGTLWIVIGDSYARNGGEPGGGNRGLMHMEGKQRRMTAIPQASGLKPKDLVGIPWLLAFALRTDGWWLRSDIIWAKPNPMPESVKDRPTRAHEYLFLFSKSEHYYYDHEAIQEPAMVGDHPRTVDCRYQAPGQREQTGIRNHGLAKSGNKERKYRVDHGGNPDLSNAHQGFGVPWEGDTRNKRSVWTVATKPFSGAHFATFPRRLVEPCVLAGSRTGDVVLDPFMGAGTTAAVAQRLGRNWIGIEMNENYIELQNDRTRQSAMTL